MDKGKRNRRREDTTEFGEFVCSNYHWLPLRKQKEQARRLENITRGDKTNEKK